MTVIRLNKMIFWELEVDFEVLLSSDGPHTINWSVIGSTVVQSVGTDVGCANEILQIQKLINFMVNFQLTKRDLRLQ